MVMPEPDLPRVRLLGAVHVLDAEGRSVSVAAGRVSSMLAMLVLRAGSVVSTDDLLDGIWGDDPPASARNALQVHASGLRKLWSRAGLPGGVDALQGHPGGYELRVGAETVDVFVAERLLKNARVGLLSSRPDEAGRAASQALGLWT